MKSTEPDRNLRGARGGSGRSASGPSKSPVPRRTLLPPHTCTVNRSDGNGSFGPESVTARADIVESAAGKWLARPDSPQTSSLFLGGTDVGQRCPAKQLQAGLVDLAVRCISDRVPCYEDAVPAGFDMGHPQTHSLAHPAFHAVSHDGGPDSPADRETEAAVRKPVSQQTQHRQAIAVTPAPTTHLQKLLIVANPEASFHNSLLPQDSIGNFPLWTRGRQMPPGAEPSFLSSQPFRSCVLSGLRQ